MYIRARFQEVLLPSPLAGLHPRRIGHYKNEARQQARKPSDSPLVALAGRRHAKGEQERELISLIATVVIVP